MTARHAVYWVPREDHPLWTAGVSWLARGDHRASATRYGFHATVKAPMRLRGSEAEFAAALSALVKGHRPVPLPAFEVTWLRDFMALCPTAPLPAGFDALATACVKELDVFRELPDGAERARRIQGLDDEQVRLYDTWGYPHLFHRWTMHLTLSDATTDPALRGALAGAARAHFAEALAVPMGAGELAWVVEPAPGAPFHIERRFVIGGAA